MTPTDRRRLVRGAALWSVLLAVGPARAQTGPEALLAAGDSAGAYRAVRDALDRGPETAALLTVRLRLERAGVGLRRFPLPVRRRRVVGTAERLLGLDPASALALETLADDDVATALFFRNRGARIRAGGAVTRAEANVRLRGSRFDIGQRASVRPLLDRSGPGREAAARARRHLNALLVPDPEAAAPLAAALAVAGREWGRVDTVAAVLQTAEPSQAALYAGLAAWRQGRGATADSAFAVALAGLAPAERARLEDVTPLLTPAEVPAYRADPDAFARAFWARRDPRLLTPESERRTEHLARTVEADLLFGRPLADLFTSRPRRGAGTDRGRVWVRYGRPDRETGFTQDEAAPTYSHDAVAAYAVWEYDRLDGGARFVFDDPVRTGEYRTYSPPASAYAETMGAAAADDYVALDRRLQAEAPDFYADTAATALPLVAARFRDPDGATSVVVAFRAPAGARAGLFVDRVPVDGSGRGASVVRLDSASTLRAEALDGAGFASSAVDVAPLAASGFGMSDLLVVGGPGPAVARGGASLAPLVADTLGRGVPLAVYAEAYALALVGGRTDAVAEARLVPADTRSGVRRFADRVLGRRRRAGVAAGAEFQGASPTEPLALALDAADLPPGPYRLVLALTDRHTGQTAEASRAVVLE